MRKYRQAKNLKGFTLVEIMLVLAIIMVLGGTLVSTNLQQVRTRSGLLTDSSSLAMEVRDMQNRTTSFLKSENIQNLGYGIYIDKLNPSKVESFYKLTNTDFAPSEVPSTSNKPTEDFILNNGNRITKICLNNCNHTTTKLAIYFIKPRPYAYFSSSDDGLSYDRALNNGDQIDNVCIEIRPDRTDIVRKVQVYYIGQVSFSDGPCQ